MNDYGIVEDWLDELGVYLNDRYREQMILELLNRLCTWYEDYD